MVEHSPLADSGGGHHFVGDGRRGERVLAMRNSVLLYFVVILAPICHAQQTATSEVVISASRTEQRQFDAAAAIDAIQVDPFYATSPLVNMSELLSTVPGLQARERQNYAQDLQISVRGFGTRSTFGVRGVRILIDGIPATMPDGQGQAATASLTSAKRIEVLRGPVAQLYGNAAGGVVQIFTADPPFAPTPAFVKMDVGIGSYRQRRIDATVGGGTETLAALLDVSRYSTDGYRDHSAADRRQVNIKIVGKPSIDTTVTGIINGFDQPLSQDPLGLTHEDFNQNPRQVIPAAIAFDTRKTITQSQAGVVVEHRLSPADTLTARLYGGKRAVLQTLAFSGSAATSSGGVIDLDRGYSGTGFHWNHKTRFNNLPFNWTLGAEADSLHELRRGYVNVAGHNGSLRRNEDDRAGNLDLFGQIDWTFAPQWQMTAGMRTSRVKFSTEDHYVTALSPDDSGQVEYRNTSPVVGLVWHASERLNLYANLGTGFETPTLAESAYRAGGSGPNFALQPSKSVQSEIGIKQRFGEKHALDLALFDSRSKNEIVPLLVDNGRTIFQNAGEVQRRGAEVAWKFSGKRISTQLSYTLLDARFKQPFTNGHNNLVAAANHLPGAPVHSLFADITYRPIDSFAIGVELRTESKAFVDDVNSDAAPGYAVLNMHVGHAFRVGATKLFLYGRLDNLLDKSYAGSVIVNDSNQRFFESAAGRRFFIGMRALL